MFTIPDVISLFTGGESYYSVHKHPFTSSAHAYVPNGPVFRLKSDSRYDRAPVAKEFSNAKRKGWKLAKLGRDFAIIEAPEELENTQLAVSVGELASIMQYGNLAEQEVFFVVDDNGSWHIVCQKMMELPDFVKLQKTAWSFKPSELTQDHVGYIAQTHRGAKNILGLVCVFNDNTFNILKSDPVYLGESSWHLTEKRVSEHIAQSLKLSRYPEPRSADALEWLSADGLFDKMPIWDSEFFFELCKVETLSFPLSAVAPSSQAGLDSLQKIYRNRGLKLQNDNSVLSIFRPKLSEVLAFKVPKTSSKKGIVGWEHLTAQSEDLMTLSNGNNHILVSIQHMEQLYALELKIRAVRSSYEVSLYLRDLSAYSTREDEVWAMTVKTVNEVKQVLRTLATINSIQYSVANYNGITHCHTLRTHLG